ncbi:hypothetical protein FBUS_07038 [Fasciolopsis buskii]|uniref:tRNA-uridine aminocarboxypropyltransferase n=1 Tax=Fasciolopsis buskii TaxID=27845 RepID=A0A8E0S4G8_9TREM|nr:hypothetical protein FBUS_07038 [Fasciolopsis buski]
MPILTSPRAYLLYPHHDAISADMIQHSEEINMSLPSLTNVSGRWLIVIDGTWTQARNMVSGNPVLMALKKVRLPEDRETGMTAPSSFVVRRQPFVGAVSTVEAVARILDLWEAHPLQPDFYQTTLLRPLHQICEVQSAWKLTSQ